MADIFIYNKAWSGLSLYFLLFRRTDMKVWRADASSSGHVWETYNSAHWYNVSGAQYAIPFSEIAGTGLFYAAIPTQIAAGTDLLAPSLMQTGAHPDNGSGSTDSSTGFAEVGWTGTAPIDQTTNWGLLTGAHGLDQLYSTGAAIENLASITLTDVSEILARTGGGGAYSYSVTVNDGSSSLTAIPAATVTLVNGINVYTAITDIHGVAQFNLNAAIYTLAATKSGYTYGGTAITVTGDGNTNISMTVNVIPPSPAPGQTTGYYYTQVPATIIVYTMITPPVGVGFEYVGTEYTATSDGTTGYWSAPLYKGAVYNFQCGTGPVKKITIPMGAGTTTPLANLLGRT